VSTKPFIPISHPVFSGNEKRYVNECLDTVWVSSVGRFIPLLEESFANFCEVRHAVACNNGTSALHLALLALGVEAGDEVIVPTLTYIASTNAIRYCNATPVLVDSEPRTMNIDPERIEEAITPRTRGILVVHLYGHPANMGPILEIARRHGLFVLEDAAEAHGATYQGQKVGSLGDAATFSFFGNKIVTTGEGGMVTTSSPGLEQKLRLLRGQGMDPSRRYWFPIVGYNYRMTNIQAALGLAQMEQIDLHLAGRRRVAEWYHKHLASLRDLLVLPIQEEWAHHVYWMYTVLLNDSNVDRDMFMQMMHLEGIETRPVFYPMHMMPPYHQPDASFPVAEDLSRRGVNLPSHGLLTEEDIVRIAGAIRNVLASALA
jgi:perosamine synthetase